MKPRIEELLDKYWEGETSLNEERELRSLITKADGYEKEKELFQALGQFRALEPSGLLIPKKGKQRWLPLGLRWAASITLLVGAYWGWATYEQMQAEERAYREVMEALALIQTNLSKGQKQLDHLNDLKYLNTTNQLFQLNTSN
ncbi:hypothetical protein J0A67_12990 [Algoriphagus aestuariicola]|uniref:Anti-sigma factor n=1 Tax=Algoriphagus aestuariicola TaxID=1852016 RepID=A0ABS3BR80_9BACT|nr:hypothetical protein [Algoriphagus aestuariicola]MBN7801782.1 hypothetical protein [Algoriphagus aestuariicola]